VKVNGFSQGDAFGTRPPQSTTLPTLRCKSTPFFVFQNIFSVFQTISAKFY
jgi:hypothetical protein